SEELALLAAGGARRQRLLALAPNRLRRAGAGVPLEGGHIGPAGPEHARAGRAAVAAARARRVLVHAFRAGAHVPVADGRAIGVLLAGAELPLVVGAAREARADVVDERVALLDLGVELRRVALE